MNRRGDSRSRLLSISIAAGLVALLTAAPIASAAEPASDEYTLDLPGIRSGGGLEAGVIPTAPGGAASTVRLGIAGENEATSSPLDSAVSAFFGAPLAVALLLAAALAGALAAAARLRPVRLR